MKTRKIKTILLGACCLLSISNILAQNQVSLTPNPKDFAQCPAIITIFTLSSNFDPSCHTVSADENCTLTLSTNPNTGVSTIAVNFFDNGMRAKITIAKLTDSNCSGAANGRVYDQIPIKTLV